ncbi:hypothetical protein, partial [Burkholderia cenocepacia]|uniref:hypothetical protein n=1 Tax=Burkholderia cenocepacia TaxID=95486 RepID=UPI00406BF6D9
DSGLRAAAAGVLIVAATSPTPAWTTVQPLCTVAFCSSVTVDAPTAMTVPIGTLVDPLKYQAAMPTATPGVLAKFSVAAPAVAAIVVNGNPFLLFGSHALVIVFCAMLTGLLFTLAGHTPIVDPAAFLIVLLTIARFDVLQSAVPVTS